jgi:hypothetical protein
LDHYQLEEDQVPLLEMLELEKPKLLPPLKKKKLPLLKKKMLTWMLEVYSEMISEADILINFYIKNRPKNSINYKTIYINSF